MKPTAFALILAFAASTGVVGRSVPNQLSDDEAGIIQVVLDDARSRWKGDEIPCLSDTLESVTSSKNTPLRISRSARVHSPFHICRAGDVVQRRLELHKPIIKGNDAIIALDYICPTCGEGTDYSLRKTDGSWRILSHRQDWVS